MCGALTYTIYAKIKHVIFIAHKIDQKYSVNVCWILLILQHFANKCIYRSYIVIIIFLCINCVKEETLSVEFAHRDISNRKRILCCSFIKTGREYGILQVQQFDIQPPGIIRNKQKSCHCPLEISIGCNSRTLSRYNRTINIIK